MTRTVVYSHFVLGFDFVLTAVMFGRDLNEITYQCKAGRRYFVIITSVLLYFLAMKVSSLVGTNLRDSYSMTAQFDNVNGLKPRAKGNHEWCDHWS